MYFFNTKLSNRIKASLRRCHAAFTEYYVQGAGTVHLPAGMPMAMVMAISMAMVMAMVMAMMTMVRVMVILMVMIVMVDP